MKYQAIQTRQYPVEMTVYGEHYAAVFSGPQAKSAAREYCDVKNAQCEAPKAEA